MSFGTNYRKYVYILKKVYIYTKNNINVLFIYNRKLDFPFVECLPLIYGINWDELFGSVPNK